jgi:hypothetical protein
MLTMDYRMVDVLNSDQLEVGDLIGMGEDIVKVLFITSTKTGFDLLIENEFGEKDTIEIADDEQFELYILE